MFKKTRIIALSFITLTTAGFIILFLPTNKLSLINTGEVSKSFSQFIDLKGADEYVVAQLVSDEEFTAEQYKILMGFFVGDTSVKLSLVAHYKYYVKLGELKLTVENDTVFIHVPKLNLSTPVAFEFSTIRESVNKFLFGPDGKELLDGLKQEVSEKLRVKGEAQVGAVYDKAAKALADNFNSYFMANGYGRHYKNIMVTFSNESRKPVRQFSYNKSFCEKETCSLELDLGKGRIFTIE